MPTHGRFRTSGSHDRRYARQHNEVPVAPTPSEELLATTTIDGGSGVAL